MMSLNVIDMTHTEPSSNVAPRASGRKIDGSLIALAAKAHTAYLTCDATAFPVPVFRSEYE